MMWTGGRVRGGGGGEVDIPDKRLELNVGKCAIWTRKEGEMRLYRCMISLAVDSIGAVDDACVSVGLVGDGGRATRSSVSE